MFQYYILLTTTETAQRSDKFSYCRTFQYYILLTTTETNTLFALDNAACGSNTTFF